VTGTFLCKQNLGYRQKIGGGSEAHRVGSRVGKVLGRDKYNETL